MKTKPSDELMEILFLIEADALHGAHALSQLSLAFIRIAATKMDIDTNTLEMREARYVIAHAADLAEAEGW